MTVDRRAPHPAGPSGPIFIGGTGRSGTTLLVQLLSRLPGVFVHPYETKFLVAPGGLLPLARKRWPADQVEAFTELLRGRWFDKRGRQGTGRQVGLSTLVTREQLDAAIGRFEARVAGPRLRRDYAPAAEFCQDLFGPAMAREGAHRWCEKTPRNALFVDQLHQTFPDMRFVHVIRDGRDVVASMIAKGFWPVTGRGFRRLHYLRGTLTAEKCARYWIEILAATRESAAGVPADRYFELRLEDLVSRPEPVLRGLCDFLGEEFTEDLLEQDLSQSHSGRWRTDLSPEDREAVQEILAEALVREGYPVEP